MHVLIFHVPTPVRVERELAPRVPELVQAQRPVREQAPAQPLDVHRWVGPARDPIVPLNALTGVRVEPSRLAPRGAVYVLRPVRPQEQPRVERELARRRVGQGQAEPRPERAVVVDRAAAVFVAPTLSCVRIRARTRWCQAVVRTTVGRRSHQ